MPETVRAAVFVALVGAAVWTTGRGSRALRAVVLFLAGSGIALLAGDGPASGPRLDLGTGAHVVALVLCALLAVVSLVADLRGATRTASAAALAACAAFWLGLWEPVPLWFFPYPAALVALAVLAGTGSTAARAIGGRLVVVGFVLSWFGALAAAVLIVADGAPAEVPIGLALAVLALLPASHLVAIRALLGVRAAAPDARPVTSPL